MTNYYPNQFYLTGLSVFLHFGFKLLINHRYFKYKPIYRTTSARSINTM